MKSEENIQKPKTYTKNHSETEINLIMNKIDFELIQNPVDIAECAQGLQRFVEQVKNCIF